MANAAASLVGLEFKLRGPNATVSYKEASGLAAIVSATEMIREGHASALAAGGVDAVYEIFFKAYDRFPRDVACHDARRALAPFDVSRERVRPGRGRLHAVARAGRCVAVAWRDGSWRNSRRGASSAAVALNAWPDSSAPLVRTMRLALDDAGIEPGDVDVVYASANATPDARSRRGRGARRSFRIGIVRGDLSERIARRVWRIGQRGVHRRIAVRQGRPRAANLRASRSRTRAARRLRLATTAVDAPGPIALVNSFASGGALFSVVLRVAV